tara:strand:+ start:173 stop:1036 length:864 start_codon:yes stop_codon:yes gene_type:complete
MEFGDQTIQNLKKRRISYTKNPTGKKLVSNQLIRFAKNSDYIIAGTEKYDVKTINGLPKLKYLFRMGSGIDNIDLDYLKQKNIKFGRSQITPEIAVAELILGQIILIYRNLFFHNLDMRNDIWKKNMGSIIHGKTIGIIGYGKVGKYLHKLLKNFGVKIIINEKKKISQKKTSLKNLIKNSDIISINTNLISNKKILDKKNLKYCKKNCVIINTSRSEVLDYDYLYLMLKKNKILGAGLDVFDKEPYFGKISKLKNVIATPHIGSYSKEIRLKMEQEALGAILKINL